MTKFLFGYLLFFRLFLSRNFKQCCNLFLLFFSYECFFLPTPFIPYYFFYPIFPLLSLSCPHSPRIFLSHSLSPSHSLTLRHAHSLFLFQSLSLLSLSSSLTLFFPLPTLFDSLPFSPVTRTPSEQHCHSCIPHFHATLFSLQSKSIIMVRMK